MAADRPRFGYMPEERGLYPRMRVRDQLVYLGQLCGNSPTEAARSVDGWLERLGSRGTGSDRLDALSHGNQQRVQLIAALVNRPELLVLDEPFSGLDPLAITNMSEMLAEVAAAGATVLFSSHQLDLVETSCEDVVIIDHGHIVRAGDLAELRAECAAAIRDVRYRGAAPDWSALRARVVEQSRRARATLRRAWRRRRGHRRSRRAQQRRRLVHVRAPDALGAVPGGGRGMNGVRQAWLVAAREIRERGRSRAFLASLVLMLVAVVGRHRPARAPRHRRRHQGRRPHWGDARCPAAALQAQGDAVATDDPHPPLRHPGRRRSRRARRRDRRPRGRRRAARMARAPTSSSRRS